MIVAIPHDLRPRDSASASTSSPRDKTHRAPGPFDAPVRIDADVEHRHASTMDALAQLAVAARVSLPLQGLVHVFELSEVVASIRLEGVPARLVDVFEFETTGHVDDEHGVTMVRNHVKAWSHARRVLADPRDASLASALARAHEQMAPPPGLMGNDPLEADATDVSDESADTSAADSRRLEFQASLAALEDPDAVDTEVASLPLLRVAIAAARIHAMELDPGRRGRLARLVVPLLLDDTEHIEAGFLRPSLALADRESEYRAAIESLGSGSGLDEWTRFFLDIMHDAAEASTRVVADLQAILTRDRSRLLGHARSTVTVLALLDRLLEYPVVSVPEVAEMLDTTDTTARKAVDLLAALDILRETSGKARNRVYAYHDVIHLLDTASDDHRPTKRRTT